MKRLFVGLLTLSSMSVMAQVGIGRGQWVCSSEGIKSYPTVARGQTKTEAKHYAQEACADYEGSSFHCDVEECVRDSNRRNSNINIDFTIQRSGSRVSINLTNGEAGYVCTSEAWSQTYIAKAPTKLEAQVISRQTCIDDGNHGMHCDVEECEVIEQTRTRTRSSSRRPRIRVRVGRGGLSIGN